MLHTTRVLLLLTFSGLCASCIRPLNIDLPEVAPIPVLYGIVTPGKPISVQLTFTSSASDTSVKYIDHAKIYLYEDGLLKAEMSYQDSGVYESLIFPQFGIAYKVEAEIPGYANLVAEDTVPSFFYINRAIFTLEAIGGGQSLSKTYVEFTDPVSAQYYEIFRYILISEYGSVRKRYAAVFDNDITDNDIQYDPAITAEGDLNYYDYRINGIVFSDVTFNGTTYPLTYSNYTTADPDTYIPDPRYRGFVELVSLSRHYYLYKKSLIYHLYNQAGNIASDEGDFDILALLQLGEPTELYSNVQGGLGLFAAYVKSEREYVYVR